MEYLREYGVACHIYVPMVKRAVVDHAVSADWTPAAGDVKISKDGGAAANVTNLPTAITMGNGAMWDFSITATEMQAAQVNIEIADSATKAVEDNHFMISTYGNASARHKVNLNDSVRAGLTALPNAAAEAAGGLYTRGSGAGQINQSANGQVDTNVARILNTASAGTAGKVGIDFNAVNLPLGAIPSLGIVDNGTAQAATATTLQLRAAAAFADDELIGATIIITGATTGAGQSRIITDYAGSTDTATVDTWQTTPTGTITYIIVGTPPASTAAPAPVNVVQAAGTAWNSGAITASTFANDAITDAKVASDVTIASVTGSVGSIAAGGIGASSFAAGAINAAAVAADAIGASELAADAATEIADAVWNATLAGHLTSGTFGQRLQAVRTATAQAGAAGTITLDASANASDDFYKNSLVLITAGTGASQVRTISGYTGSSKVAAVTPNWVTNPASDSVFVIIPNGAISGATAPTSAEVADAVWDEARSGHVTGGSFGEGVASVQGAVTGSVGSVTGAVGSVTGNVNGNVVGTVSSVTGNVNGNVVGSVASVTGGVGGNLSGSVGSLAAQAKTDVATAVFARAFSAAYNSLTFDQIMSIVIAVLAGKASGMGTATGVFRNLADSANVVVATQDADGDRTAVTLTP